MEMDNTTQTRVPILALDVSKDRLDAFCSATGEAFALPNSADGHRELCRRAKASGAVTAMEASGGYEQPALRALHTAGLPARLCDPRKVRLFARASGQWAKNDRLDARAIAAFAQAIPGENHSLDQVPQRLAELVTYRRQIVDAETTLGNQARHLTDAALKRDAARRLATLKMRRIMVETRIAADIKASPGLAARAAILNSVPGIGPVLSAVLLAEMPELGHLGRREVAALVGVAPIDNDSGKRRGPRSTYGGRATVRTTLYMAALVAGQRNKPLAEFRARLLAAGKKPKVAIVAVMRKLIVLANALLRDNRPYRPA